MNKKMEELFCSYHTAPEKLFAVLKSLFQQHGNSPKDLKHILLALPPHLETLKEKSPKDAASIATLALEACGSNPHFIHGFVGELLRIFPIATQAGHKKDPKLQGFVAAMSQSCKIGMDALTHRHDDLHSLVHFGLKNYRRICFVYLGVPMPPEEPRPAAKGFFARRERFFNHPAPGA